jgi:hypothetical protein
MLLRALKDLDNERAIGKIEDEDYAQISQTYRDELKVLLKRIDASLAPHRAKAEAAAKGYLEKAGLTVTAEEASPGKSGEVAALDEGAGKKASPPERLKCPSCKASNEPDAKFCKECAAKLGGTSPSSEKAASSRRRSASEESDDE